MPGIIVTLLDDAGATVATDTTDEMGNYFFGDLNPGDYELVINSVPDSLPLSSTPTGGEADDGIDGNDNGTQVAGPGTPISSGVITLAPDTEPIGEGGPGGDQDDIDGNDDDGDMTIDFGLVPNYSIGSTVFADFNNDAVQGADEEGLPGIAVTLYEDTDGSGDFSDGDAVLATTSTDADGNYFFDGLLPGDYLVGIEPTEAFPLSSNEDLDEDDPDLDVDGNDNGIQADTDGPIVSGVVTLGDGTDEPTALSGESAQGSDQDDASALEDASGNQTVDFGLFPGVSIGSTVFEDLNGDGIQNDTDQGISGVEVILYGEDPMGAVNVVYATTQTDADGNYFFGGLPEGDYIVAVVPSTIFPTSTPDPATAGDGVTDSDDDGQFADLMQGTGLTTGSTVYSGVVTLEAATEPTDEPGQGGAQDADSPATDANGNMTVDFGFTPGVSVGSTVFFDVDDDGLYEPGAGEVGIAGVEVILYAADGITELGSTTTDEVGNYFFGGLDEGTYQIGIPAGNFEAGSVLEGSPASSTPTDFEGDNQLDGSDNGIQPGGAGTLTLSGPIELTLNGEPVNGPGAESGSGSQLDDGNDASGDMTVDFGFIPIMSIGSQVFQDLDDSGDISPGEGGIDGVEVLLFSDVDENDAYTPGVDTLVSTTVTADGGTYLFDTLSPGDYIVAVVPPEDNNANSDGPAESIADDQVDNNDNGFQAMIGDTVFSVAINLSPGSEPTAEFGSGGDQDDGTQDDDGDMTVDFGLFPSVSVGSTVFEDTDNSGVQEPGEPGVPGIVVTLLDEGGAVLATDTTDADGNYLFTGLPPGDYELTIATVPDSLPTSSTPTDGEGDDGVDGNDNGIQAGGPGTPITSGIFTLTPNAEPTDEDGPGSEQDDENDDDGDMSIDFGLVPNYSLGSTVFADFDNDGLREADEDGVAGVDVVLYVDSDLNGGFSAADELLAQTSTDAEGNYYFGDLLPGQYIVGIEPTEELPYSSNEAVDVDDPDTDIDGDDNGIQDMMGAAGAPIYSAAVTLGDGEPTGAAESDSGGDQDDASPREDAAGNQTVDFGLFRGMSIGSNVFADLNSDGMRGANEQGIADATVLLYRDVDMNGIFDLGVDELVAETTTDANGTYLFDQLPEGDYFVGVEPTTDFPLSSINGEEADPNNDIDNNDNGIQNTTGMMPTAGETVLSGVVTLSAGDEPADGDEFAPGGNQDVGNDSNGNMTVDFAFNAGLSVGSTVFLDLDNNGIYEPTDGESGIAGVQVLLYAEDGTTVLDSTLTDDNGNYFFGGLDQGTYQVGIPASSFAPGTPLESSPASSTPTDFEGDNQLDGSDNGMQPGGAGTIVLSGPVELTVNGEPVNGAGAGTENAAGAQQDDGADASGDMTIDFGFFPTLSIGSQVFADLDNSGDLSDGELGIDDVEVLLFADVDGNNSYTPGVDTLVDMTTTMGGGLYEFDTLSPGDYVVAVVPPVDNDLSSSGPAESAADDQVDGNDNGLQTMAGDTVFSMAINLTPGEEPEGETGPGGDQDIDDDQDDDGDMTVDFGLLPSVSVGSSVFQDNDNSGLREPGEDGLEGILITLLDAAGAVVATDTTDADGNYFFEGLVPGDYELVINEVPDSLPNSSDFPAGEADDGVDDNDNGMQPGGPRTPISSGIFTLAPNTEPVGEPGPGGDQDDVNDAAGDMTIDFGLVPSYSVGSTVFEDSNNDATQGDDEAGVPGVPVTLYADTDMDGVFSDADSLVATTVTDADGNYFFEDLLPGDYIVGIEPTEDLPFSSNEDEDEDDPNSDTDGDDNGIQAAPGEPIYSGVVTLGGPTPDEPTGGDEDGTGGDQDGSSGLRDAAGNQTVDFGLFPGVSLGSNVFADVNSDGMRGPGEDGIEGAEVFLYLDSDMDGVFTAGIDSPVATTITDADGNYLFEGLPEGDYFVGVVPTDDFPLSSTDGEEADPNADGDNNDNGIANPAGMTPIAGDTVLSGLVTLSGGDEPIGTQEFASGGDQDDTNDSNGNMTVDFAFNPGVSLGSTVFFDLDNDGMLEPSDGETGIPGVQVILYADDGLTVLDSTITDDDGNYFFGGLDQGDYIVGIPASSFAPGTPLEGVPNSSTPTDGEADDGVDNNDNGLQPGGAGTIVQSGIINLATGEEPTLADGENGAGSDQDGNDSATDANGDMTVDFGFFPTMSIGSQVFADLDNSGDLSDGETGLDDVEVLLFADVNGDNTYTPGVDTLVDMTVTTGGGLYEFDTLAPGDYIVAVVPTPENNLSSNGPAESAADDQVDGNDNGLQVMAGDTVFSTAIDLTPGTEPEGETGPGGDQDIDDDQDDDGDMTVDFGLLPSLSVGSSVFQDNDGDGIQDATDQGVSGIVVTLLDEAGNVVATDTTDEAGNYFFDGLAPGDYELALTEVPDSLPNSSDFPAGEGDDGIDGNDNGIQEGGTGAPISSGIFTLTPNDEPADEAGPGGDQDEANDTNGDMTIDFGLVPNYSVGSTVFADSDNSATQDEGEEGVAGIEVVLYEDTDMDGAFSEGDTLVAMTTTDEDGNYLFDNLAPGDYIVGITPSAMLPLSSDADLDEDDPNTDVDGDDNGTQAAAGDPIYSGAVTLGGDALDEPAGTDEAGQGGDQDDASATEDAAGNQTVDFGLFPGMSLGSTVFFDLDNDGEQEPSDGETGIQGVPVFLLDEDGSVVASTLTDDNGNYLFAGLAEGTYEIQIPEAAFAPGGALEGATNSSTETAGEGDDGVDGNDNGIQLGGAGTLVSSGPIELMVGSEPTAAAGENGPGSQQDDLNDANGDMTVDFGFYPTMSIGSAVFQDLDNSGDRNDGETGIDDVTVLLFADTDGNNVYTPGVDVLVDMTTTMNGGLYEFDTLAPGDYIVAVVPTPGNDLSSNGPAESAADDQVDGNDNGLQAMAGDTVFSTAINLAVGEEPEGESGPGGDQDDDDDQDDDGDMTIDFGLLPSSSVGSTVFQDNDGNGLHGPVEMGVAGIEVTLLNALGNVIALDTTDSDGAYLFDGLPPGDYEIVLNTLPESLPNSSDFPEGEGDDGVDGNDNGLQPGGPLSPISSGIFTLTPNGEPTDEAGPNSELDDENEDDGDLSIDFGLVPNFSIGSTVFSDVNDNAVQDEAEGGVPDIEVSLFADTDMDGAFSPGDSLIATTTTDADGNYFFENLFPGDYVVAVTPPLALPLSSADDLDEDDPNTDVDGDDNGMQEASGDPIFSGVVTLGGEGVLGEPAGAEESGQGGAQDDSSALEDAAGNQTVDFGLFGGLSVGSTVFLDENNDGLNSLGEPGLPGVQVVIFDAATMTAVDSVLTDDSGNYLFTNLSEGDYYIEIPGEQLLGGNGIFDIDAASSTPDFNADDDIDNNDDGMQPNGPGTTVSSGVFTLSVGDEPVNGPGGELSTGASQDDAADASGNMTIDFGLFNGVFDLALIKDLAPGQSTSIDVGDTVDFQITVINQGNLAADNIVISDYFNSGADGYIFPQDLNPQWAVAEVNGDSTRLETTLSTFNGTDTLAMNNVISVGISLIVNPANTIGTPLPNLAEISAATGPDNLAVTDIDSPMDTDPNNDLLFEDNEIDGNGLAGEDEDNHDGALIAVGGFDLALIKTIAPGQSTTVAPGEDVVFDVTVINQGGIPANNIGIVDYIPDGFLFNPDNNPGWTAVGASLAVDTLTIAAGDLPFTGLLAQQSVTRQIVLTVAPAQFPDYATSTTMNPGGIQAGMTLTNAAEISTATDENGITRNDFDSTPDSDPDNDGEPTDNELNSAGNDEDDHDIAVVEIGCYQDPGIDSEITVCLGCNEGEVTINLFESLDGLPNIGGTFTEGALIFMDDLGNPLAVDLSDPENVVLPGTLNRSRNYSIDYTIAATEECEEMLATITIDIFDIQNLSCTGYQNISLGEDCNAEITPDLILQGNQVCASALSVVLLTTDGDTIRDEAGAPTAFVSSDQVNETLYVTLVDEECDNSCWGQILVEDKKRPTIECPADISGIDGLDFICSDLDSILNRESSFAFTGMPVIADNCTAAEDLEMTWYDFLVPSDNPMCEERTIMRTFEVTDESGNLERCVQRITIRPPTLADVTIPEVELLDVNCSELTETLPNGNPLPSATPAPVITTALGTLPLEAGNTYCALALEYSDSQSIPHCDASFEFTRSFTLYDWCAPTDEPTTFSSIIRVVDKEAPTFTSSLPDTMIVQTNTDDCGAIFRLDDPGISIVDGCSDNVSVRAVIFPEGDTLAPIGTFFLDFDNGEPEMTTSIPAGEHLVRYTYVDGCGNQAITDLPVSVIDRTTPFVICDDGLNVSLSRSDNGGVANARLTTEEILVQAEDDCGEIVSQAIGVLGEDLDYSAVDYGEELLFTCEDLGTLNVALRVTDESGNSGFCHSTILIEMKGDEPMAPEPVCTQTVVAVLRADTVTGSVLASVLAAEFVSEAGTAGCGGDSITSFSIYRTSEEDAGTPVEEGRVSLDVGCTDEEFIPVRIYSFADGQVSTPCTALIQVTDPDEICEEGEGIIAGIIMTEGLEPIENTEVDLAGATDLAMNMTTADDGNFAFRAINYGEDYTVTPSNFTDYLNGVRTSDIVAITRHILATERLDSPYKYIAADVDGNGEVNVGDIIHIRRLILGLSENFPNDMPSWSYVPTDYEFDNLRDPWAEAFPLVRNYNNLEANVIDADFVGVKLGDVNGSAQANALMPARQRSLRGSLELEMRELELRQGETYRVPVTAPKLTEVDGYQFTLQFDQTALTVERIEPGLVNVANFGLRFVEHGIITSSWNWEGSSVPEEWTGEEVLFTLVIKAEAQDRLSQVLEAGSRYTEAEAYERGGQGLRNLDLVFNEDVLEVAEYRLLQNTPNPVTRETVIGYELPRAHDKVTIAVMDATGRLVRQFSREGFVGYNSLRLTKQQLGGASGVFTYTVAAGDWVATKRMVVIE